MAKSRFKPQSVQAAFPHAPVAAQNAAGPVAVNPAAPIICAAVRALGRTKACSRNAAPAAAPIHSSTLLRPAKKSQINAKVEIAVNPKTALRTNWISAGRRGRIGVVPIQDSTGVRSQNRVSTATVSGARLELLPPAANPTAAPVTSGTSRIPQAPCSRGINSDFCRKAVAIILSAARAAPLSHDL